MTYDSNTLGVLDPATRFVWLDYSYLNADVAAAHLPCVFPLPIGTSTSQRALRFSAEAQAEVDTNPALSEFLGNAIDAVHIGGFNVSRREHVIDALQRAGATAYIIEGTLGASRARLLGRSSVGLNVHRLENRRVAEAVRLMTYLASGLSAVSEAGDDARLEAELSLAVDFVRYAEIAPRALELLREDPSARASRRARARAVARARDTKALLARSLSAIFPACRSQLDPGNLHGARR